MHPGVKAPLCVVANSNRSVSWRAGVLVRPTPCGLPSVLNWVVCHQPNKPVLYFLQDGPACRFVWEELHEHELTALISLPISKLDIYISSVCVCVCVNSLTHTIHTHTGVHTTASHIQTDLLQYGYTPSMLFSICTFISVLDKYNIRMYTF